MNLAYMMNICSEESEFFVEYVVYGDVYILINFMMDAICLLLVRRLLYGRGRQDGFWRVYAGALFGSVGSMLVLAIPMEGFPVNLKALIRIVLLHGFVNSGMLIIGLHVKKWSVRHFLKAYAGLYIGSFLVGGVMQVFAPYIQSTSIFFTVTVAAYYLILGIYSLVRRMGLKEQVEVIVHFPEVPAFRGLVDTGNSLTDPITGKMVSIISKEAAKKYLGNMSVAAIRYIPYKTVSGGGVMPVVELSEMEIQGICQGEEVTRKVNHPLIGIGNVSNKDPSHTAYDIIVSPKLW